MRLTIDGQCKHLITGWPCCHSTIPCPLQQCKIIELHSKMSQQYHITYKQYWWRRPLTDHRWLEGKGLITFVTIQYFIICVLLINAIIFFKMDKLLHFPFYPFAVPEITSINRGKMFKVVIGMTRIIMGFLNKKRRLLAESLQFVSPCKTNQEITVAVIMSGYWLGSFTSSFSILSICSKASTLNVWSSISSDLIVENERDHSVESSLSAALSFFYHKYHLNFSSGSLRQIW